MSSISTRSVRRWGAGLAAAALATGVLSGCGVAGTEFRPGVAADVGDVSISMNDIDEAVDGACIYFTDNRQEGASPFPRWEVRQQLAQLSIQRAVVEQLVDETGAELGGVYETSLAQLDASYGDLPAEQSDGLILGYEAATYVDLGLAAVGQALLADEGQSNVEQQVAGERGLVAFGEWVADHDVEINPIFSLALVEGELVPVTDDVSVPQSVFAAQSKTSSTSTDPDKQAARAAYVKSLPSEHLCG